MFVSNYIRVSFFTFVCESIVRKLITFWTLEGQSGQASLLEYLGFMKSSESLHEEIPENFSLL